ncbi:7TM_GPCR_Srx domain-containing protein [Caenorhabditis elegans]|uniref:7TM_GPCR_Srx domain-containing protein n=1 Tax=Caenorhabditis elegans TaxID=6239 RepID=A4UVM3_CAEEL|nr:7TM_GPCR_Srx domain-containing protein [Caenorhabditis elegans]CCD67957.2 7TM_GPCR_Srx domain-containing protein [Caenorhabditis elegans]|eukprot:NP_001076609.2 Uncharacterized protein CELE_M01D7.9 [Caenorhabditis elegans]
MATWAFWVVISYFLDPSTDTRAISTFINSLFVAAPIPGTVAMIIQNASYRNFIAEKVFRRKSSDVSPSRYVLPWKTDCKTRI